MLVCVLQKGGLVVVFCIVFFCGYKRCTGHWRFDEALVAFLSWPKGLGIQCAGVVTGDGLVGHSCPPYPLIFDPPTAPHRG